MEYLQEVVAYWRDCIKSEGALEQNFGISPFKFALTARTRAVLFQNERDPFIFADGNQEQLVGKGRVYDLVVASKLKGREVYFGYPLLMFFDRDAHRNKVAPLFVMRLEVTPSEDGVVLRRGERSPVLGNNAFEKLGLRQEEIVALNEEVDKIFDANQTSKLETILYLLKKETNLTFIEAIDPQKLSLDGTVHPYAGTVIYNKAIVYASEASAYNLHTLNDLEQLAKREDLSATSLRYVTTPTTSANNDLTPVLPFTFDEYHLRAIRRIVGSEHTVVTGPPGTGKSQFIANLIVNLFLQKKRVLFVSHTGEAVRVVNERINQNFANLMMQTGKKEIRQDLGRRLEAMVDAYNVQQVDGSREPIDAVARNWHEISSETAYLHRNNELHKKVETTLRREQLLSRRAGIVGSFLRLLVRLQLARSVSLLRKRRTNSEVLAYLEDLRRRHVEASRSYVRANYLALILDSGLYGKLLAYIDAVQNRRPSQDNTDYKSEKYIHVALQAMNVWSCTLKSLAATFPLRANLFDYVIFDEASQIDLPSAAPALYRAQRAVVVGDENQLNHIARMNPEFEEELARKHRLLELPFYPALVRYTDASLFNSAKRALDEPELELKNHYRSNSGIANLFSSIFYGGRLKIYEPESNLPKDITPGVRWVDVKGAAYKYKTGSRYNPAEARQIVELLRKLVPIANERGLTVGVATAYSKQQDLISRKVVEAFEPDAFTNVRIMTVHKFQGSEVDILLLSLVVSQKGDGTSDFWYVKNKQILNVAVSRAKQLLLIVGDYDFALQSESKLRDIAVYCAHSEDVGGQALAARPMNVFEKRLLEILKDTVVKGYVIEPQHVIGNRFTVDFALLSTSKKIAIELDGRQHEIIGGLPTFEDTQRDAYLAKEGWLMIRITVYTLLKQPNKVVEIINRATDLAV